MEGSVFRVVLTLCLTLLAIPAYAQSAPQLGGTWELDREKSGPSKGGVLNSWEMTITQGQKTVKIAHAFSLPCRTPSDTCTLNLDGTPSENGRERGPIVLTPVVSPTAISVRWVWSTITYARDGDWLTVTITSESPGPANGTKETFYFKRRANTPQNH
jgi:hypothetical protein